MSYFLLVLCALLIVWFARMILGHVKWWRYLWYLRTSLPGPPRHWLLGNIPTLGTGEVSVHNTIRYFKDYPDLYVLFFGPFRPGIVLTNIEYIRTILKSTEPKSPNYLFLFDWIGDGLLLSSGDKWFKRRKMLTPAFHFDILKSYVPVVNDVSHVLLDIWQEHADKGTSFNVFDYISLFTLDVLLRCAFSDHSSSCLAEKDNNPYVKAVHGISQIPRQRFRFLPYHINWIFKLSPMGRRFHQYVRVLHEYSEKAIGKRRKQLLEEGSASLSKKYVDFLDILLSAKDEDGNGLTDVEIREEVNTFMFEGHDTTASGLCWTLYCLAKYPEHQEKCRSEVKELLSNKDDVTWEDLNKLVYTSMCIKESMRMYPPVPLYSRQLSQDYTLDGYKLQKGSVVTVNVNGHHHNPRIWPDPEKFDPQRFSAENAKTHDSFAFIPFSAGPRNCIGQNFAMNEMKIAIAHIINRFRIEVDPLQKTERVVALILRAKYGILLKLSSL
ncbi:cytochrome P450 4B1-like [Dysidea avara]|uniref:cytochrome P450 4B1-like n=1 Tax=Dysidea avara TaxID=196820 RepID=UPI003320B7F7